MAPAKPKHRLTDADKAHIDKRHAEGAPLRTIGDEVGVADSAVYAYLRRGSAPRPPRRRHWGRRAKTYCNYCGASILVQGGLFRPMCDRCSALAAEALTIYDRDKGIGEIPANLVHRLAETA